ncbi:MAG: phenylacetate--CoA ligase family protein [Legionellales bacterium]
MEKYFLSMESPIAGIEWPNIPNQSAACSLGMLRYLESSQWLAPEVLKQQQFLQLTYLLEQASQFVPYYRDHDYARFCDGKLMAQWSSVPLLTRQMIQQQGTSMHHEALSPQHGTPVTLSSSGSTGQPVSVLADVVTQFFFNVLSLRHYHWHQYDFKKKMAVIRDMPHDGSAPPKSQSFEHWGSFTQGMIKTSPCHVLPLCDVRQQAQWLGMINPDYLMCYPTVLRELLFLDTPKPPHLKSITTFGELVDASLKQEVSSKWHIPLVDMYSSSEMGYIALQCPDYDHYHVQDENVLVEILDEDNHPCPPGATGRIVITALHNLASPLIRYDIGDYAQVGEPCPCGRGLSVIKHVLGRQRNMLTLPNGEKRWPTFTGNTEVNLISLFKNMQFQVIQKNRYDIEIALVSTQGRVAEDVLIPQLQAIFGHPFHITFNYVSSIARAANGKFEDFKSLL